MRLTALLFLAGCAAAHQRLDACHQALASLIDSQLDRWQGLPQCRPRDLDAALRSPHVEWQGSFGRVREYRQLPTGLLRAQLAGGHADEVTFFPIALTKAQVLARLGEPEKRAPSRLFEPVYEQWIYASRGLAIHIERSSHQVGRIFGFAPMTLERFLESRLFYVEAHEEPR